MRFDSFQTDKVKRFPGFNRMADYERFLGDRQRPVTLLELGVLDGESLLLWRSFFPRSTLVGFDRQLPKHCVPTSNVTLYRGEQDDVEWLAHIGKNSGPFDIIVDDCSHFGELSKISFWALWPYLKAGGLYVVEDWGTGYLKDWPDGHRYRPRSIPPVLYKLARRLHIKLPWPCHSYGMVGFAKELMDRMAMFDIGRKRSTNYEGAISPFQHMVITPGAVIITKREEDDDTLD